MGIWMGVVPGLECTRVLVQDGAKTTLLKARMPVEPKHPRALEVLCEAIALWCGKPVRAAVDVDALVRFCDPKRWGDSVAGPSLNGAPLFEIRLAEGGVRGVRRERDGLEGMGDFRDVRQLVLFEVAK